MNHKKSIIAVMVVAVVASSLYGAWELRPPSVYISGTGQLQNWTYEEMVKKYPIVIHGVITDVQLDHITIDEHGHVADPNTTQIEKKPMQKITIHVIEVYKDTFGIKTDDIIVYDWANGIGETIDGERAQYYYDETTEYQVGADEGIFFIFPQDDYLSMIGYASYYPIIDGKTTTITELEKDRQKTPIDLDLAKQLARADQ